MKLGMAFLLIVIFNVNCFCQEINIEISNFTPVVNVNKIDVPEGFEIDLINRITENLNLKPIYHSVEFCDMIKNVQEKKYDMGSAGISITSERENLIDFSQPTFNSGYLVAHKKTDGTIFNKLITIWNDSNFISILISFMVFLFVSSICLYLSELGQNQISDNPIIGLLESFWCVNCTITTVGYGDIAAKNVAGRIVTLVVMYTGISFFALFVGVISSSFSMASISDITCIEDLKNSDKTIGVVSNTTSEIEALKITNNIIKYPNETELLNALINDECNFILYDYPWINNTVKNNSDLEIIGEQFGRHHYGFIFSEDNIELKNKFNLELLKMRESGEYERIYKKWFS